MRPNVGGNRRAARDARQVESMNRRVRLTVRLAVVVKVEACINDCVGNLMWTLTLVVHDQFPGKYRRIVCDSNSTTDRILFLDELGFGILVAEPRIVSQRISRPTMSNVDVGGWRDIDRIEHFQ